MGKKSVGILIGVAAVAAVLGGTGYYFRDDIRQMIPIFDDGSSEDKVYVEKVSRIMNQYAGVSNRYNGVVEDAGFIRGECGFFPDDQRDQGGGRR